MYLHASDATAARDMLESLFSRVAELGEEAMIAGDFNMERWSWPISGPTKLCELLMNFYDAQRRWFMWQGCFHPFPGFARRGLLQGCPASPCL